MSPPRSRDLATSTSPRLRSLLRNQTTAKEARTFEDGPVNPLTDGDRPFSTKYRSLLEQRRALPVASVRQEFLDAYHRAQVLILTGDNGTGKTTQIPQFVLYDEFASRKTIACVQATELAALLGAIRVADELDVVLGEEIGYSMSFGDMISKKTRLQYMTAGALLHDILLDKRLHEYSCVIIDDAHERTLEMDLLMALLKHHTAQESDLKLVVMSTNLDASKFQNFFRGAPLLQIPGRQHPFEVFYLQEATPSYMTSALRKAKQLHEGKVTGDMLVFLATSDEVEEFCAELEKTTIDLDVLPLHAALP